jgi:hypothetical protein
MPDASSVQHQLLFAEGAAHKGLLRPSAFALFLGAVRKGTLAFRNRTHHRHRHSRFFHTPDRAADPGAMGIGFSGGGTGFANWVLGIRHSLAGMNH